jgi:hypothetical protein
MPKRASKRVSKRRKSKQIKKRRNTNKKRFFGGELSYESTIFSSLSPLYNDLSSKGLDNPEVNRRNVRFFNVYTNYANGIELFKWLPLHNNGKALSAELKERLDRRMSRGLTAFDYKLIRLLKGEDTIDSIKTEINNYFNLDHDLPGEVALPLVQGAIPFSQLKTKFDAEKHDFQ